MDINLIYDNLKTYDTLEYFKTDLNCVPMTYTITEYVKIDRATNVLEILKSLPRRRADSEPPVYFKDVKVYWFGDEITYDDLPNEIEDEFVYVTLIVSDRGPTEIKINN